MYICNIKFYHHLSEAAYQTSPGLVLLQSLFVPLSGSLLMVFPIVQYIFHKLD